MIDFEVIHWIQVPKKDEAAAARVPVPAVGSVISFSTTLFESGTG